MALEKSNRSTVVTGRSCHLISIVIPLFNEEMVFPLLRKKMTEVLGTLSWSVEVLIVDDGSSDKTADLVSQWSEVDSRIRLIQLARNFGHQIAITAGIDEAEGDAVVVMDGDLQDPPELIQSMVAKYLEGYDVVYARRLSREKETFFKQTTAKLFYLFMKRYVIESLPRDVGDFRLMSKEVVLAFRLLREKHRFVRGLIAWLGFRQTCVEFHRSARASGETKYPFRKMAKLALDAAFSFSSRPLRVSLYFGSLVLIGASAYTLYVITNYFFFSQHPTPGWTTLALLVLFMGGSILMGIGILGEYIGRIYDEQKGRPLYVVRKHEPVSISLPVAASSMRSMEPAQIEPRVYS